MSPDTLDEENTQDSPAVSGPSAWTISEHEGFWAAGSTAGGSRRYKSMYMTLSLDKYDFNINLNQLFDLVFLSQKHFGRTLSSS